MANIILRPRWQGRASDVTPEPVYRNRRAFLKQMGIGTAAFATSSFSACSGDARRAEAEAETKAIRPDGPLDTIPADAPREGYPAARNNQFTVLPERPITDRLLSSSYNNFYEFRNQGDLKQLWHLTGAYEPFPMTLEIAGLVEKPFKLDIGDLIRSMDLEERVYRLRCVEAWSITVPWTGFPLRKLIERAKPLSKATHVRFVSAYRPKEMPGMRESEDWGYYQWPYFEGLRMDEATNELAFVVTGMYGEPLPKQNGSPIRLALPWKYGYKGPKAIVRVEFIDHRPETFWHALQPNEYGFYSNVNPNNPHPRWSQATEEIVGTEERVPTQLFNGYGEWVADLYPDEPRQPVAPTVR